VVTDRAQGHTLEAVVASLLLLAAIGFALQMTAVTPLSASTSSQHLENQMRSTASGVLASAAEKGALRETVLYWNNSTARFHGTNGSSYYTDDPPNTTFGGMLRRTFDRRNIAYNVEVHYQQQDCVQRREQLFVAGEPSDHAVSASRSVAIMDGDHLYDADTSVNESITVDEAGFFAPDVNEAHSDCAGASDGPLYNLVRVEVIAWRI